MRYAQSVNGVVDLVGGEEVGLTCERTEPNVRVRESEVAQIGWLWDEEMDTFIDPTPPPPTLDELKLLKTTELLAAYNGAIYTTVPYLEKVFGNSKEDQDTVDEVVWTIEKGMFTAESMPWNTYGGAEAVDLTPTQLVELKAARILQKQAFWQKFNTLSQAAQAATTEDELAAIVW